VQVRAEVESKFVRHEPCPKCGSKDNLARYSDGHAVCFSGGCSHYEHGNGEVVEFKSRKEATPLNEVTGITAAITDRRLSQDTCRKFGVTVEYGNDGHIVKHHYPYFDKDTGELRGSKTRLVDNKQFFAQGSFDNVGLFGQQAFKEGGKYITVVEGELDALAVSEMFDGKWPVVSIRSGAASAAKDIKANLATEDNIGILALEEDIPKTTLGLMSLVAEQPLHLDKTITREEKRKYWEMTLGTGRYYLLDHWGSTHEENLLSRVRYMAKGLDCKWIFLDHLSIVVSDQEQGDERKAIDSIMTKLRQLVQETGIGLFLVSHLRRPSGGKGHEDGAQVSLADLRGSAAIAQLSDMVIGLERNQQHKDEEVRNTTTVRVLKNRFAGLTGPACYLYYDKDSGRITETNCPVTDDDESEF
jgi:transcription initiation factor TFIIIB Brf1 subunit/transcription initiation factor TFIIB